LSKTKYSTARGAGNNFYYSICPKCDNIHRNDEDCIKRIKSMEQDIEDLKKKTDFLNSDLNYFKTEYDYDEKHIKHGNLEKELAQHRKEDPETMKVLDEMRTEMDRRWEEYSKKKFMEDGTSEEEWKKYNKEIQDLKRKAIHKDHT